MKKFTLIGKSLSVSPNVHSKKVNTTWYLLLSNAEDYISLNESASLIWELLLKTGSVQEIIFQVAEYYGVEEKLVEEDVLELLAELVSEKILVVQSLAKPM